MLLRLEHEGQEGHARGPGQAMVAKLKRNNTFLVKRVGALEEAARQARAERGQQAASSTGLATEVLGDARDAILDALQVPQI